MPPSEGSIRSHVRNRDRIVGTAREALVMASVLGAQIDGVYFESQALAGRLRQMFSRPRRLDGLFSDAVQEDDVVHGYPSKSNGRCLGWRPRRRVDPPPRVAG